MQGVYNWRGGGGGKMGSVTASPVTMMVLMLALSRVRTTGEGVEGGEMGSVTASPVIMMVLMLALCRVCITGVV